MSAQVEDRHREAARTALNSATPERHGKWHPEVTTVAQLIADTEAAERERSATRIAQLEWDIQAVDGMLSNRDALDDLPWRCDKIGRLLRIAKERDPNAIISERERYSALRVEFEACVRALRKIENTGPFHMADKEFVDAALLTARDALSGPLAMEVADA